MERIIILKSSFLIINLRAFFDSDCMRYVYILLDKVFRCIVVFMFVPVDLLITRFISFLGRRLLFFLLWILFLRIFRFLALIQLLLSQFVRFPFVMPVVWIILNLRLDFIVMTFTDRRLVIIVVTVLLFNHFSMVWLLEV